VRLVLNSDNAGHGLPLHAIIECQAPDAAGEIVVPAALIEQLPEFEFLGICVGHDCPPSSLARRARATVAAGDAVVELVVASEVQFWVTH
jgi:hypothetical protein